MARTLVPNRLSFWIVAAVVVCAVAGVLLIGISWLTLIALLQVPQVLAVFLLARAIVQAMLRQPWALRAGGRDVLGGAAGFVVPVVFLLALTIVREAGLVSLRLSQTRSGTNRTSMLMPWTDEAADTNLQISGIAVHAPDGALGSAFAQQLKGQWLIDGRRLYADVAFTCDPPTAFLPLVKSATVNAHVDVRLQLRADPPAERTSGSKIDIQFEHQCTMLGIASRRDFHEQIGSQLGGAVREAIDQHLAKANQPR